MFSKHALPIERTSQLQAWLDEQPLQSPEQAAESYLHLLVQSNKAHIPAKQRLRSLELLRTHLDPLVEKIRLNIVNKPLPLQPSLQSLSNHLLSLHLALVEAYMLVVRDLEGQGGLFDRHPQLKPLHRVVSYLGEVCEILSSLYEDIPQPIWEHLSDVYRAAEKHNLLTIPCTDPTFQQPETQTIEGIYKQIMLFVLARPFSLPQSQIRHLYRFMGHFGRFADIAHKGEDEEFDVFTIDLDGSGRPGIVDGTASGTRSSLLSISPDPMVDEIRSRLEKGGIGFVKKVDPDNCLSEYSLNKIIVAFTDRRHREFSRSPTQGEAVIAIGRRNITSVLDKTSATATTRGKENIQAGNAIYDDRTVETVRITLQAVDQDTGIVIPSALDMGDTPEQSASFWEQVAIGNILSEHDPDSEKLEQLLQTGRQAASATPVDAGEWRIVNHSAGGYRFNWENRKHTPAHVGEIVGIWVKQDGSEDTAETLKKDGQVGIIRWMKHLQGKGLDMGVEVIANQAFSIKLKKSRDLDQREEVCILLPAYPPLNRPATLVTPSHLFSVGDRATATHDQNSIQLKLTRVAEQTGIFTQFEYRQLDDAS